MAIQEHVRREEHGNGIAIVCDPAGTIQQVFYDTLGIPDRAFVGQTLTQLIDRGSREKLFNFLASLRKNGATFDWEMNVPVRGAVTTLHFVGLLRADQMIVIAAGSGGELLRLNEEMLLMNNEEIDALRAAIKEEEDYIREHRRQDAGLYDEITRLNNELVNLHREVSRKNVELETAKSQVELFLDLMSHDINNMNQLAMGYLEMALQTIEKEDTLRSEDRELIERPLQALANSSALIDSVRKLQMLMTGSVKTKPVELADIFRTLGPGTPHSSDRDIVINLPDMLVATVWADDLLRDVFVNLIGNAIKHSDEKKPLTIDVRVEATMENGKRYYRCTVEDNGPGIPDVLKGKLFHRFQRGPTKAHGKGLGLFLVRTLVESYHGKVWVEDRVEGDYTKGARFVIMLPAVND